MEAYKKYEDKYFSLRDDQELLGVIYEMDGDYYYSEPLVVGAKADVGSYTFNTPDGVTAVAAYHAHPPKGGGSFYFSGMEGDAGQVMKEGGIPMYLRNEIGDVRVLTKQNYNFFRKGESICGGHGQPGCLAPHPRAQSGQSLRNAVQ